MAYSEDEESIGPPRGGVPKQPIQLPAPPPPQPQDSSWDTPSHQQPQQPQLWDNPAPPQQDAWNDSSNQPQNNWDDPPNNAQTDWNDSPKKSSTNWEVPPQKSPAALNGSSSKKSQTDWNNSPKGSHATWNDSPKQSRTNSNDPSKRSSKNVSGASKKSQANLNASPKQSQPEWNDASKSPQANQNSSSRRSPRLYSSLKPQGNWEDTSYQPEANWDNSSQKVEVNWDNSSQKAGVHWADTSQQPQSTGGPADKPQQPDTWENTHHIPGEWDESPQIPEEKNDPPPMPENMNGSARIHKKRDNSPRSKMVDATSVPPPPPPPQQTAIPHYSPPPQQPPDIPKSDAKPKKQRKPKSVNLQRPPTIPEQPFPSNDSLLKLLRTKEFSDVGVVVGTGKQKRIYKLHRNILCTKSEYFCGAIQTLDADPKLKSASVVIRDLLPPIFDLVLEWIYGEILILEHHQPLILALYRAASFLKIHSLKIHIARSTSKMLKHKRKHGTPLHFDGFEVIRGLFEYAGKPEYFTSLRKCTDELALQFNLPFHMIDAELEKGEDAKATQANTKFWMALAMSYQKALHATVCSECRCLVSTRRRSGLDRMCCHCDTEDEDESGSPPPREQRRQQREERRGEERDGRTRET
ncbi:hypothetical protein TWF481_003173 [Arthrobotrys musiformis]|uniref:BTB domain-containing protein n=1 Tax=Arthrobotrys musiformis TaxID=47236 RepID=A0AAV9VVT8_9PEZI